MAYMANDKTHFTNRPQMVAHNSRLDAAKSKKPSHTPIQSHSPAADVKHGESDHSSEVTCPHCGGSFDAGEVAASRDLPHGFGVNTEGGENEF